MIELHRLFAPLQNASGAAGLILTGDFNIPVSLLGILSMLSTVADRIYDTSSPKTSTDSVINAAL